MFDGEQEDAYFGFNCRSPKYPIFCRFVFYAQYCVSCLKSSDLEIIEVNEASWLCISSLICRKMSRVTCNERKNGKRSGNSTDIFELMRKEKGTKSEGQKYMTVQYECSLEHCDADTW